MFDLMDRLERFYGPLPPPPARDLPQDLRCDSTENTEVKKALGFN
jgi:hypothetical protein